MSSGTTVGHLVGRFNRLRLAALRIQAGRERKPTYDSLARALIVATAQRAPVRRQDGPATWSLASVQRTLRPDTSPRIGTSTMRRVVEQAGRS